MLTPTIHIHTNTIHTYAATPTHFSNPLLQPLADQEEREGAQRWLDEAKASDLVGVLVIAFCSTF